MSGNKILVEEFKNLKKDGWFKKPLKWSTSQWYIIGLLASDLSVCDGALVLRWGRSLKFYVDPKAKYLACGNKDSILTLFEYLCVNNKLPSPKFLIFKVRQNKFFKKVTKVNLSECAFEGTRESEVHFLILMELEKRFTDYLLKNGFLFDITPGKKGILERHLPINIIRKLDKEQRLSLLAGLFDGDGSVGAVVRCPSCGTQKTLRKHLSCPSCGKDIRRAIYGLDCFFVLDSRSSLLDEEIILLDRILGLKGHLYLHLIKKEYPTQDPANFDKKVKLWKIKIKQFKKLEKKYSIPLIYHENVLKEELPSFKYAPDISGSIRFRFSPFFKKKSERIEHYGIDNFYAVNIPILLGASKYMNVKTKKNLIKQFAINKHMEGGNAL